MPTDEPNATFSPPILQELLPLKRWTLWRLQKNPQGRRTKRPLCASTLVPTCWLPWSGVQSAPRSPTQGVGLVTTGQITLKNADGDARIIVALDLDACRDPQTGELTAWARVLVNALPTVWEITPSGTGLRAWLVTSPEAKRLRHKVSLAELQPAPNVGDKRPELQLFGLGPAGYVTVSFQHLAGTPTKIREIDDLQTALQSIVPQYPTADVADGDAPAELPVGVGPVPTIDEIKQAVSATAGGPELLCALWADVQPRLASASEAFFTLVLKVLRAANGHGAAALSTLLASPWGAGYVDGSADPSKYTRREWVAREIIRAAAKSRVMADVQAADPTTVFGPVDAADTTAPAAAAPPAVGADIISREFAVALDEPLDVTQELPPRRYLLRRVVDGKVQLFGPRAVAGVLASAGGTGKSMALLQLAVCLVTGRPWFGFEVEPDAVGQRVLLVLAEEPRIEVQRRLRSIARSMDLDDVDVELIRRKVVVLPLAGKPCALTVQDREGQPHATHAYGGLLRVLRESPEPWSLVALDPLARLFPSAENSNELATFSVQHLEALVAAPGEPLVMLAHHSSKMARRVSGVDSRGVTGLEDAVRWVLTMLRRSKGVVELRQAKANYSIAIDDPVLLRSGQGGVLRLLTDEERVADAEGEVERETERELTALDAAVERLVTALVRHGPTQSLELLAKRAGIRKQTAGVALKLAVELGKIAVVGPARSRTYQLPGGASDTGSAAASEVGT